MLFIFCSIVEFPSIIFPEYKKYTVLINGQTGKIKGDYPKSPVKIGIIVAAIVAILVLIFSQSAKGSEPVDIDQIGNGVVYETDGAYGVPELQGVIMNEEADLQSFDVQ